jgi:hypothetical protein
MAETIDTVIDNLNSLNKVASYSNFEFQGFAKTLIKTADSAGAAGRKWTILSRFLSGTPLWKVQNYIRATIGVMAEFEKSTQAQVEAEKEVQKNTLETIKGYEELSKSYDLVSNHIKKQTDLTNLLNQQKVIAADKNNLIYSKEMVDLAKKTVEKLEEEQKLVKDILEDSVAYQKTLMATGDEETARFRALQEYTNNMKKQKKIRDELAKATKDAYAFDSKRIQTAREMAKVKAKEKGLTGRARKKFIDKAVVREGRKRQTEQRKLFVRTQDEAFSSITKFLTDLNPKKKTTKEDVKKNPLVQGIAPFLAPVAFIGKTAKLFSLRSRQGLAMRRKFYIAMNKFTMRVMKVMDFFFKYMMLGIFFIGAVLIGLSYLKELYGILKEMGIIDRIKDLGKDLMSILSDVFSVISAFISGDYEKIIPLLNKILDKGFKFVVKGLGILLEVGFFALVAGFKLVGTFIKKAITDADFQMLLLKAGLIIAAFIVGAIVVKLAVGFALMVASVVALPLLLGIVIVAALYTLGKYFSEPIIALGEKLTSMFESIGRFIVGGIIMVSGLISRYFQAITNPLQTLENIGRKIVSGLDGLFKKFEPVKKLTNFLRRESGGPAQGITVVGEGGPELLNLPAGSRVHSNKESRKMMGGTTNNINITINARDTSDQELRRIADKIGQMVNTKINRTTSSRTFGG